jgi:hypothetical protein
MDKMIDGKEKKKRKKKLGGGGLATVVGIAFENDSSICKLPLIPHNNDLERIHLPIFV